MNSRREFLRFATLLAGSALTGCASSVDLRTSQGRWRLPDESQPHQRTWMAFGASRKIWGKKLLPEVQRNLAAIATTIARYEPVTMLVREHEYELARRLTTGSSVELIVFPMDDLWMRDTGPIFVRNKERRKAAVDFNFNGWGRKQTFDLDTRIATFVAEQAGVKVINTDLILEGGAIEVDGKGTAVIAESCVLNRNRNPGITKTEFERKLSALLGLTKTIWLPGIKGEDITDGHTDFYVRFVRPGVVVAGLETDPAYSDYEVTRKNLEILRSATDAQGRPLDVTVLESPRSVRTKVETDDFAAGYMGFYVCNGAVIMQEFGDVRADRNAGDALQKAFPDREIVQLNADAIAAGGGTIHCTTQQEPAA